HLASLWNSRVGRGPVLSGGDPTSGRARDGSSSARCQWRRSRTTSPRESAIGSVEQHYGLRIYREWPRALFDFSRPRNERLEARRLGERCGVSLLLRGRPAHLADRSLPNILYQVSRRSACICFAASAAVRILGA